MLFHSVPQTNGSKHRHLCWREHEPVNTPRELPKTERRKLNPLHRLLSNFLMVSDAVPPSRTSLRHEHIMNRLIKHALGADQGEGPSDLGCARLQRLTQTKTSIHDPGVSREFLSTQSGPWGVTPSVLSWFKKKTKQASDLLDRLMS